ncbi:hypothetical protein VNO80_21480 [Phaseolus coccineus]|uniref:Uncharacterized protein n=1 Tax=Phaseolus coccineus TaxID=3886 RepID=A0AAN9QU44_PHACN
MIFVRKHNQEISFAYYLLRGDKVLSHGYGTPSFRKRRCLLLWPSESVLYLMQVWPIFLSLDISIFFCYTGELKNSTVVLVARFGVLINFPTLSRKSGMHDVLVMMAQIDQGTNRARTCILKTVVLSGYAVTYQNLRGTKCQQEQHLCFCIGVNRNSEAQKVGTAGNFAKTCLGHPNVLLQAKYILKNGSV